MRYYYFVFFRYIKKTTGADGWGNCEIIRQKPITTYDEIREIAKCIKEGTPAYERIIIENYILLREEHDGAKVQWT